VSPRVGFVRKPAFPGAKPRLSRERSGLKPLAAANDLNNRCASTGREGLPDSVVELVIDTFGIPHLALLISLIRVLLNLIRRLGIVRPFLPSLVPRLMLLT